MYKRNLILSTDSYKHSHFEQYPDGAEYVSSYIEARGCDVDGWEDTVLMGVQGYIKEYLLDPVTMDDVEEAAVICAAHGVPFNREGWEYIVTEHDGMLPLVIEALPEGSVVNLHTCLVQVQNTDPKVPWLTSFIETGLLRAIWYPTTVATQSREIKKIIKKYMMETAGHIEGIDFKLHDFGSRGVSSGESAAIGGMAHMVNFMGSDTMDALVYARRYYHADMVGFSIPATEHSTVTSWGKDGETEMYRRVLDNAIKSPSPLTACVSDSYNIYNACQNIWGGTLKHDVEALEDHGKVLVVRPDSGDPRTVPVKCIEILSEQFGYTVNELGYKVLPPYIRVIQGDGINHESIGDILENLKQAGFSAENIAFGMGGALLQGINRDTFKFAMKASAIRVNGEWRDVFKDPIEGGKSSKSGRLMTTRNPDNTFTTYRMDSVAVDCTNNAMNMVYRNGVFRQDDHFDNIRERAKL